LAFVGIAHQILLARKLAWHETPLEASRETGATASAQRRLLDGCDHLILRQAFAAVLPQDLPQGLVATTGHIVLERPVAAIHPGVDLGVDVAVVKTGLHAGVAKLGDHLFGVHALPSEALKPSMSWSSLSWLMKLHMWRSLTSITGESAHAPRHSLCCSVNMPSGVVSPMVIPSFSSRYARALPPSRSWQGKLVQTLSLNLPTRRWLYML